MVCYTHTDLTRCLPVPRVTPLAEGVWELAFPTRTEMLPVAEVRVVVTAAQVAAIARLVKEG
jgi:hypothetical protein